MTQDLRTQKQKQVCFLLLFFHGLVCFALYFDLVVLVLLALILLVLVLCSYFSNLSFLSSIFLIVSVVKVHTIIISSSTPSLQFSS